MIILWYFVLVLFDPAKSAEPPIKVLLSLVSAFNINSEDLDKNEITSRKREEKLKNISNILRTPSGLTNLIDEPAFKRNGIDLEETPHSSDSEISNQTLSLGDDNVVQLKQNNSFLHDNVD